MFNLTQEFIIPHKKLFIIFYSVVNHILLEYLIIIEINLNHSNNLYLPCHTHLKVRDHARLETIPAWRDRETTASLFTDPGTKYLNENEPETESVNHNSEYKIC